jgi:hypothetical protein
MAREWNYDETGEHLKEAAEHLSAVPVGELSSTEHYQLELALTAIQRLQDGEPLTSLDVSRTADEHLRSDDG